MFCLVKNVYCIHQSKSLHLQITSRNVKRWLEKSETVQKAKSKHLTQLLYKSLQSMNKSSNSLITIKKSRNDNWWKVSINVTWPTECSVEGDASTYLEAEKNAFASIRELLESKKFLEDGKIKWTNIISNFLYDGDDKIVISRDIHSFLKDQTKSKIYQLYSRINHSDRPRSYFHRIDGLIWKHTCSINWPEKKIFHGFGENKKEAENLSYAQLLWYLNELQLLNKQGYLIQYSNKDYDVLLKSWNTPHQIIIPDSLFHSLNNKIIEFENLEKFHDLELSSKHTSESDFYNQKDAVGTSEQMSISTMTGRQNMKSVSKCLYRSAELLNMKNNRLEFKPSESLLPTTQHRSAIINLLLENRICIISGETGCGKSTQIPQFILEHYAENLMNKNCNIIVTQPRRISAISLAQRIAYERKEKLGETVGYQIRLEGVKPPECGGILFCSVGILLKRLQQNPSLNDISHVIIDEVHERSMDVDFLMIILKEVLKKNPNIHLILMSASMDTSSFSKYFNNAPHMHIQGTLYPVMEYYLEDVLEFVDNKKYSSSYNFKAIPTLDSELVAKLISAIDMKKPDGSILCFLPGWQEIKNVETILRKENNPSHLIIPLHSQIPSNEQLQIFNPTSPGIRKIVLATNIAETSITINDIVYVVNSGLQKENHFNPDKGYICFDNYWSSLANMKQRKGRAGRLKPGEIYHLFPESHIQSLRLYPIPEIQRTPLEKVVLDAKIFCSQYSAEQFLSKAIQPPPLHSIHYAVQELQGLGMLDQSEYLTPLGKAVASFTTPPRLSKALIFSLVFGCIEPMLTIAAVFSSGRQLFLKSLDQKKDCREVKLLFNEHSDHLAMANIFMKWNRSPNKQNFCYEHLLIEKSMRYLNGVRTLLAQYLVEAGLVPDITHVLDLQSMWNRNAHRNEIIESCLLAGFAGSPNPNLITIRQGQVHKGQILWNAVTLLNRFGKQIAIQGDSVNKNLKTIPNHFKFMTYLYGMQSQERHCELIRDTTMVSPIQVLLFTGQKIVKKSQKIICSKPNLCFDCNDRYLKNTLFHFNSTSRGSFFILLHDILPRIVNMFITSRQLSHCSKVDEFLCEFDTFLSQLLHYEKDENKNDSTAFSYSYQDRMQEQSCTV